ncbi:hypothetical protein [Limnoglobus roseus]|uniref:Uncharacterized protein n=1 Tax=Limnoglobus roseus TaxID=2598579 RepID=A0A5C1ADU9_9BACT|nr:hypothetical protein [Limnoglobus roseus]QEL17411.1 hypothetical protein PX52LOC_04400 [Limnoglobus roseus]
MSRIISSERWSIEFKPAGARRWTVIGTVGTREQAEWFMLRFLGTGDWYIRPPKVKEVARA